MAQPVTVRKVESKQDYKAFFNMPWTVYRDDPLWVPPLLSIRRETLSKDKNPAWEYLEGDYYVAWRGDRPVGTIAAIVNKRHNEFQNEHIAWFGFFETDKDPEAAAALLTTAEDWGRESGYDAIRGPQSFTTHEECGLLVDGFTRPVLLMPYNPRAYQGYIEDAGFIKAMDTFSFYYNWDRLHESKAEDRLRRLQTRLLRSGNINIRGVDRKNLKKEFALFKDIYNSAWEHNWGFVPMTPRELDALIKGLGDFFDARMAFFAEVDGKPAGFFFAIPDMNQALKAANPRPGIPEPITLLRVLWHWKIRPVIDTVRIPLLGVVEEHRNKGLDLLMYIKFMETMKDLPYRHLDSGWVLESNANLLGLVRSVGMDAYKTYRFYEKALK